MENNENGFQSITDADLENARTIIKKIMSYYMIRFPIRDSFMYSV